jgi:hypothetical protein
MDNVYRLSGFTKVVFIVSILWVLFFGWVFVDACIDSAKADNGYVGVIVTGIGMVTHSRYKRFLVISSEVEKSQHKS